MKYNPINMYKPIADYMSKQGQSIRRKALVGLAAIVTVLAVTGCQDAQSIRDSNGKISPIEQKRLETDLVSQKELYERTNQSGMYGIPIVGWRF